MRLFNSARVASIAQNTMAAVAIETMFKACGRPAFIYLDKNTKPETKKYSATKELLYQGLCLGIYLTLINGFKRGGYALARKVFKEDADVQAVFDACKDPIKVLKKDKEKTIKGGFKHFMHAFHEAKDLNALTLPMKKIKGGVEALSIVGSILGLALLAPQISHVILHPIMKFIGLDKKEPAKAAQEPKLNKVS